MDVHAKKLETLRRLGAKICGVCNTLGQETLTCQVCRQKDAAFRQEADQLFMRQMKLQAQQLADRQNRLGLRGAMRPNSREYRRQVLDHADDIREAMGDWDMGNGLFGGNPID